MTTTANPLPTRTWKPNARDRAIYRAVVIEGRTQRDAGQEFGRSQSAVSRLLKRFERWRGGARPDASGDLDPVRQCHFDRWLARQRHDEIYSRAMRLARRMEEQPATAHREGQRGETVWHEDQQRDQLAAAGQMLKTALRANEALDKFPDKKPLPFLPEGDPEVDQLRLLRDLDRLRMAAEKDGLVRKSRCYISTVRAWLNALVGERVGKDVPSEYEPGTAFAELAQAVIGGGYGPETTRQRLLAVAQAEAARTGGCVVAATTQAFDAGATPPDDATARLATPIAGDSPTHYLPTHYSRTSPDAPTHQTHTRIFVGGHPPVPPGAEAVDATPELPTRWDPLSGCGRVVMIDPSTGKKNGQPDESADDPLGRLYRRMEERQQHAAREARRRAAGGG